MKKIVFTALAILVIAISLIAVNKRMNKGNLMDNNNTYIDILSIEKYIHMHSRRPRAATWGQNPRQRVLIPFSGFYVHG